MSVSYPNESADYRAARDALLTQERDLRSSMEAVAQARRDLPPGGPVPKDYAFEGVGPDGEPRQVRLSELFREGGDSVLLYQMMFPRYSSDDRELAATGQTAKLAQVEQPCPSCTALLDQLSAATHHFEAPSWNMFDLLPQGRPDFSEQLQYACCGPS